MAGKTVEYKDFSGGDWGRIGPEKAPKNTFSGTNVLPYRTGELGVRPGVRNVTPTGLTSGAIWGMGTCPGSPGFIWFGKGTAIQVFAPGVVGPASTASGALTGTPSDVFIEEAGATTYLATNSVNGYSFNGSSITSLNNMPVSQAIALYGDRLAVVPTASPNTVRFSAAASFNNWTVSAGNAVSITVGDTDPITALFAQRGHLVVVKKSSAIYIITGTPGTNEALRQAFRFDGPITQNAAGRTRADDKIWFAPQSSQYLAEFDGTRVEPIDNYPLPLHSDLVWRSVIPFKDDDHSGAAFLAPDDAAPGTANEVWLRYRGSWTRHTIGATLSQYAARCFHGYPQEGSSAFRLLRYGTCLVFTDGGSAGAAPLFYAWQPFMDRPGLEVDPFSESVERPGDATGTTAVTGTFELPHYVDDAGNELMVQRVRVEFRSWNTGASDNTRFDVAVRSMREYDGTYEDSEAQTWEEAPAASALAGTYRRKEFSFGDQGFGSGFQLRFSNLKGVAIRRIVVSYDTRPPR
jgi:hypothetical protein